MTRPGGWAAEIEALSAVDRRLTFAFGVVIMVLMFSVLGVGGLYMTRVMDHEERQLSTHLAQVLASSVSRVSFSGKYHAQLLLNDIKQEQDDIGYLHVTDAQATVLASSDRAQVDQALRGGALEQARRALKGEDGNLSRRLTWGDEPILEVTLPYRGGFDHSVQGVVQVGVSQKNRDAALRRGIQLMSVILLVLMGLGMLVVGLLSRHFGNPVKRLAGDLSATLQAVPDLLFELDSGGHYLQAQAHDPRLLADTGNLIGRTIHEVLPEPAAQTVELALREAAEKGASYGRQIWLELPQGVCWFELSVARKESVALQKPSFVVLSRDITDRVDAQKEIQLYANVFRHSGEAIMVTDRDNRIVAVNPSLEKYSGYRSEELVGKNPNILSSGHTPRSTFQEMWESLSRVGYWQGELWDRRKNGETYPKWVSISAIRNEQGLVSNYIASYTDITDRKIAEQRIDFIAHHDPLTGLTNRFSLEERMEQALLTAERENTLFAVMFIDMDRFKDINDTLGHHTGDALLVEVGSRLRQHVRKNDIVARLGGDEFVTILLNIESTRVVANIADGMVKHLGEPYAIDGVHLHSTPSIGISLYPDDGQDVEELMKNADVAMYHAKDQGRNNYQFFSADMNRAIKERLFLENELRLGLAGDQFLLHYQPISCPDGGISGFEALVRWQHPVKGLVPPTQFIPVAEQTGLIVELGGQVMREACRQGAEWRAAGRSGITISVNLSIHQLYARDFIGQVRDLLAEFEVPEGELKFEITESIAMKNPELAIEQLLALRDLGIRIAIDDFGTGYSSLAYLKLLPIDTLKLDRTFVKDIETDLNDVAICTATIALAHSLGLKVVAEGVETEAQRDFLLSHQCDLLQGYLVGRPVPAAEIAW